MNPAIHLGLVALVAGWIAFFAIFGAAGVNTRPRRTPADPVEEARAIVRRYAASRERIA